MIKYAESLSLGAYSRQNASANFFANLDALLLFLWLYFPATEAIVCTETQWECMCI